MPEMPIAMPDKCDVSLCLMDSREELIGPGHEAIASHGMPPQVVIDEAWYTNDHKQESLFDSA